MENTGFSFAELLFLLIPLSILGFFIASFRKIFVKAGKPGWAVLIPIYNIVVFCDIIGKPRWWTFLMIIPYIGLIWSVWGTNLLVKKFGKNEGFTVGCVFLPFVFYPILGFGDARYSGAALHVDGNNSILDSDFVK